MTGDVISSDQNTDANNYLAEALDEDASKYDYAAFISYRRSDASVLANWLRHRLQDWRPTRDLLNAVPQEIRARLQQERRVFVDTRFEVGNEDFWQAQIEPALARSAQLIVLSSPAALQTLPDGTPNWVEREISSFYDRTKRRDRITLVLCPRAAEGQLPGNLRQLSERWDWADLRGWSPWRRLLPGRARAIDDAATKILASVLRVPTVFVPIMRQEEASRTRRRRAVYALASLAAIATVWVGGFQTYRAVEEAARANEEAKRAGEDARQRIIERRREESHRLADQSLRATESGDAVTGILLALRALPDQFDHPNRPVVNEVWPALRAALASRRELLVLPHDYEVNSIAFSPSGLSVVTAADEVARVWQIDGNGEIINLRGHSDMIESVAFSPDGTRVVTASDDNTARVWRLDGNGEPEVLQGHGGPVVNAAFSSDGRLIVTSSFDHTARVWRAGSNGKPIVLHGHEDVLTSASFSPDGTRVVTASDDNTARVWSLDGSGKVIVLRGHDEDVTSAAFSSDGKLVVTASRDTTARVWHLEGGGEPIMLRGHLGPLAGAAFSPDGTRILTWSPVDNTVRVWRSNGDAEPIVLRGQGEAAMFSHDGSRVVTASDDKAVRVWRIDGGGEPIALRGHDDVVTGVQFSPNDTQILTVSRDHTARVWQIDDHEETIVLGGHSGFVASVAFSPDGTRLITVSNGTARVWRADGSGKPIILQGHTRAVNSAEFSPDGTKIVTSSDDGTVRIWQRENSATHDVFRCREGPITSAKFSPDGRRVLATNMEAVCVWQLVGSGKPTLLAGYVGPVKASFSREGIRVVSCSPERAARVWQPKTGKFVDFQDQHCGGNLPAYNTDGTLAITASEDGTVKVWPSDGSRELVILRGHSEEALFAKFKEDGTGILTAGLDLTTRSWPADGSGPAIIASGYLLALSADEKRAITTADGNSVRLWQLDGDTASLTLLGHDGRVTSAAFSPVGMQAATGSEDGTVRVWPLVGTLEQLATYARSLKLRQLTEAQEKQYFIGND